MESRVASSCWFACSSLAVNWLLIVPILPCVSHSSPLIITQSSPNVPTRHSILHLYFDATVTLHTELFYVYFTSTVCPLTHSLTAALDQLRVVASSTSNDPGPRSRQHQQIGQCLLPIAAANLNPCLLDVGGCPEIRGLLGGSPSVRAVQK